MLGWKLAPIVSQLSICHRQVGGPHAGRVRGRRGASSDKRHVLVAWIPTKEHGLVHVLRDGGVGDGLGRGLQAGLAAQAAAVAAEAAQLPPGGVVGSDAPGLGVEGVVVVNVVVVSVPGGKVLPGPRCYADHGGEGQGGQEGEEAEEEQALEAIIADASEGVQVVLAEEEGRALGVGGLSLEAPPPLPAWTWALVPSPIPSTLSSH